VAAYTGDRAVNDVVNIGNDNETTVLELARTIVDLTGSNSKIVHLPPLKEGDMTRRMPDIGRMRGLLGRQPLPLREGLVRVLADTSFILD
jgi:nucleoside-diphosphate-sugar epimerase